MLNVLRVPFEPQSRDGYCLPACASMILRYWGKGTSQQKIARLLGTSEIGTPLSRIRNLAQWGFQVDCTTNGKWQDLVQYIAVGKPVIVSTHAEWLPYSQIQGQHVIVINGITETSAFALDPAAAAEMIEIDKNALLAAWTEMDLAYAVITLR